MVDEYGFRTVPAFAMINNVWCKRPDIVSIRYKGHNIMVAPLKMMGRPIPAYKTLEGAEQPMFFDIEHKLRNWNLIIKNTPHIQRLEEKEWKNKLLAEKLWQGGSKLQK